MEILQGDKGTFYKEIRQDAYSLWHFFWKGEKQMKIMAMESDMVKVKLVVSSFFGIHIACSLPIIFYIEMFSLYTSVHF